MQRVHDLRLPSEVFALLRVTKLAVLYSGLPMLRRIVTAIVLGRERLCVVFDVNERLTLAPS